MLIPLQLFWHYIKGITLYAKLIMINVGESKKSIIICLFVYKADTETIG